MRRARISDALPAGNPTMMRTDRVGYVSAFLLRETSGSAAAPDARCRNLLRGSFMASSRAFEPASKSIARRIDQTEFLEVKITCSGMNWPAISPVLCNGHSTSPLRRMHNDGEENRLRGVAQRSDKLWTLRSSRSAKLRFQATHVCRTPVTTCAPF